MPVKLRLLHHCARVYFLLIALPLLLWASAPSDAQTVQSLPPQVSGYVNDLADVIDAATEQQIEAILKGLHKQAGIEFAVMTVKTTGGTEIFDYSLKTARQWGLGSGGSRTNALLLLVSTDDAKSFMQKSRLFKGGLPDGLIAEVNLRMRNSLQSGKFGEALMTAVQTIVATLSAQRGLSIEGVDQKFTYGQPRRIEAAPAAAKEKAQENEETARPVEENKETSRSEPAAAETDARTTRKRTVKTSRAPAAKKKDAAVKTEQGKAGNQPPAENQPGPIAVEEATAKQETPVKDRPIKDEAATKADATATGPEQPSASSVTEVAAAKKRAATPPKRTSSSKKRATAQERETNPTATEATAANAGATKPASSEEDESEEVELTLTLPVAERIEKLKAFLEAHPHSAVRARAQELIISARAALGDIKLKAGDTAGGIEQFRLAIEESPAGVSDRLFNGVIAQLPLNLFMRGERAAAYEAARAIEARVKEEPKRLVALSTFYLGVEDTGEAARLGELVVKLAPEMSAAHQALGAARRIALRLDDAAAEYARAYELDPKNASARRSLADLRRATGKAEEALALYREQLQTEPADKQARTGLILALFDAGKREEAERELEAALKDDPRNLPLLVGAAYWYAAHDEGGRALELGQKAAELEPRYTWTHIVVARSLVARRRPLEAERALRFARQYGRFATLDYELASALASMGLYEEAAEELARSFSITDGEIQTQLAGRIRARAASFTELLAPERRASIFQPVAADTESQARILKGLLALTAALNPPGGSAAVKEAEVIAAVQEFTAGGGGMRTFRQLYAASRLLKQGVALQTALELAEAATAGVEAALGVPAATVAAQADELREIRASAIARGGTPDVPDAPRNVLSNMLRGRIEEIAGWALFNQEKTAEAIVRLRRAASVLPEGTPLWRTALWHLGAALETSGNGQEALASYIKSYNGGPPDPTRRTVIENLYRKVNGSLEGLDEKIGPLIQVSSSATESVPTPTATETQTPATEQTTQPTPAQTQTPAPEQPNQQPPAASPSPPATGSPRL